MIKNNRLDLLYGSNKDELSFYRIGAGVPLIGSIHNKSVAGLQVLPSGLDFAWVFSDNKTINHYEEKLDAEEQIKDSVSFEDLIDYSVNYEESSNSAYSVDDIFDFGTSSPDSSTSDDWFENSTSVPFLLNDEFNNLTVLHSNANMSINKDIHSTKQLQEKMDPEYVFIDVASPSSVDSGSISEDDLSNNTQNLILELLGLSQATIPDEVTTFNVATVTHDNLISQLPTNSSLTLADDNYASDESVWQMQHKSSFGKAKVGASKRSSRTIEQRLRKKVQNRKAASRYRDKKKYELDDIFNGAAGGRGLCGRAVAELAARRADFRRTADTGGSNRRRRQHRAVDEPQFWREQHTASDDCDSDHAAHAAAYRAARWPHIYAD